MTRRTTAAVAAMLVLAGACTSSDGGPGGEVHQLGWRKTVLPTTASPGPTAELAALLPPATGSGWLAIGTLYHGGGRSSVAVWESGDAMTWRESFAGPQSTIIVRGAARHGGALVIVGEERLGPHSSRAEIWTARAGSEPYRVSLTPALEGGMDGRITFVTGGTLEGQGFLATGTVGEKPAVWRSPNGRRWERDAAAEELLGSHAASVSTGMFTSTGPLLLGRSAGRMVSWHLRDGEWREGSVRGDPEQDHPQTVIATDTGLLAAGYAEESDRRVPRTWTSTDGADWLSATGSVAVPAKPISDSYGVSIDAVGRVPGGFLAAGGGPSAKRVWSSRTGTQWDDVALPPEMLDVSWFNVRLLASDGQTVLLGSTQWGRPILLLRRGETWHEVTAVPQPIPSAASTTYGPGLVITEKGLLAWSNLVVHGARVPDRSDTVGWWRSEDGTGWDVAPVQGPFDVGLVLGVAPSPSGWTAVGGTPFSPAGLQQPDGPVHKAWTSSDGAVWEAAHPGFEVHTGTRSLTGVVSRDGRAVAVGSYGGIHDPDASEASFIIRDGAGPWRKLADVPGASGPGTQNALDVCASDKGFVAVGSGPSASGWFSPDGLRWQLASGSLATDPSAVYVGCVATTLGFLAVGTVNPGRTELLVAASTDGIGWAPADSRVLDIEGTMAGFGVAAEGDDALIVATYATGKGTHHAMWRSSNAGGTWDRLDLPAAMFGGLFASQLNGAAIRNGTAYVIGVVDNQPVVWSSPLAEADVLVGR